MSAASVPVDLANPGQVFACLGFMEISIVLCGDVQACFDWSAPGRTAFRLRTPGDVNPFHRVVEYLRSATARMLVPPVMEQHKKIQDILYQHEDIEDPYKTPPEPIRFCRDGMFPFPEPKSLFTLPVVLESPGIPDIVLDHWGDGVRDDMKLFAGQTSGLGLVHDVLLTLARVPEDVVSDPFSFLAPMDNGFRFDPRRDWDAIHLGYSPNEHQVKGRSVDMVGYPLVEILSSVGLTNARPKNMGPSRYRYGVLGNCLPDVWFHPMFLRAALGADGMPFDTRCFLMSLDGKYHKFVSNVVEDFAR